MATAKSHVWTSWSIAVPAVGAGSTNQNRLATCTAAPHAPGRSQRRNTTGHRGPVVTLARVPSSPSTPSAAERYVVPPAMCVTKAATSHSEHGVGACHCSGRTLSTMAAASIAARSNNTLRTHHPSAPVSLQHLLS